MKPPKHLKGHSELPVSGSVNTKGNMDKFGQQIVNKNNFLRINSVKVNNNVFLNWG